MLAPEVIVDGIVFETNSQIGIWRIFYETMQRSRNDVNYTLVLSGPPMQPVPDGVTVRYSSHRARHMRRWHVIARAKQKQASRSLGRLQPNAVWHPTYYSVDPNPDRRALVTVYDMIADIHFLSDAGLSTQASFKEPSIERASCLVPISDATRGDLLRFYPHKAVTVASALPMGAEHLPKLTAGMKCQRQNVCLFVGARYSYKNFLTVLEAIRQKEWPNDMALGVVGKPFDDAEIRLIRAWNIGDRITHYGYVDDSQLALLYRQSLCMVFPSRLEGFGIPILESQANGCIPLVSDTPVFREVAGSGAIYFDSRLPRALADAVCNIRSAELRETLLPELEANLTRYSWDDCASRMVDHYLSLSMT